MKPTAEELFGPAGTPRVVVVGAGFGGIAAGVKMKQAGIHTFTIYESSLGIGGTWWDNTYPGAEVDVGSHLYCFSFKPHDWTRTHAKQPELQKYLEETVDEFGLRPHLRLGVAVESATWDDDRHVWTVQLDDGTVDECHVLVSGVGFLNVPRYPDWPGLDDFAGPKFHTARWEHQHDLTGKVVAVVGTGSSATQVVPAIQPIVEQLYVFQREPGWVMPKGERDFTDEERAALAKPWRRKRERWRQKYMLEKSLWRGHLYRPGTKVNEARAAVLPRLHRPQVRRPPRPARGGHAEVPVSRQAARLRQHLLLRAQEGERGAGPPGRGVGDAHRHRRRRREWSEPSTSSSWPPASSRRTTWPASAVVGRGGRTPPGALGGRAARLPRHHGAGRSRTSSCSTGRAPTVARS